MFPMEDKTYMHQSSTLNKITVDTRGPRYLISAWISNYTQSKVCGDSYPCPNFDGAPIGDVGSVAVAT